MLWRTATSEFWRNDPFGMAGSIAYTTLFSLPAFLMIVVWLASTLYDQGTVRDALFGQLGSIIGAGSAETVRETVEKMRVGESRFYAKVFGIGVLVFTGTALFITLQNSINRIWRVRSKPRRGLLKFVIDRALSLAMVAGVGFLLLVSLVIDAVLAAVATYLDYLFADQALILIAVLNLVVSLLVIAFVFAMVFKFLPDARVGWREVRSGALVAAVLFVLGKSLIGLYIGSSKIDDAYGAAGSIIVILLWVYYSAVIVLFGAEFTYVYARDFGKGVFPVSNAVRVELREVEKLTPEIGPPPGRKATSEPVSGA